MGQEATNSHLLDHKQYKMYLQHNEVFFCGSAHSIEYRVRCKSKEKALFFIIKLLHVIQKFYWFQLPVF